MHMQRSQSPSRQKGITMVLVTVALVVIIGMTGLALDMGHAYLNNTRLQNALDATALSGAKTVNGGFSTLIAETDAVETFNLHLEGEMADAGLAPTIEFSATLDPFVAGAIEPDARYVRARVNNFPMTVWFARVLPGVGNIQSVAGSAVSGPSPPLGGPDTETCDIAPFMFCDDSAGTDTDCTDGDCYGYPVGEELCLKSPSPAGQDSGSGNNPQGAEGCDSFDEVGSGSFQLVELSCGSGGNCIRKQLAGEFSGCLPEGEETNIDTEPGNKVGPVAQGLNTRFGQYAGPVNINDHPPDVVTGEDLTYSEYQSLVSSGPHDYPHPTGVSYRRVVAVPVGTCDGAATGSTTLPLVGMACFFLTQPAVQAGNQQGVYGELIESCQASGEIIEDPPDPSAGPPLFKIILYKDANSRDS